jgi:hypothetical protein
MELQSTSVIPNQPIPLEFTGEGADRSPAIHWEGVPDGARQIALICDDPDAPQDEPWIHWVIYNIPADRTGLGEGIDGSARPGEGPAAQGLNSWGNTGYGGPMPPPGHGTHHYHFRAYALDLAPELPPELSARELRERIEGHILDQAEIVGTFERQ